MFRTGQDLRLMGEVSPLLAMTVGLYVVLAPYIVCICSAVLAVLAIRLKSLIVILHVATCVLVFAAIKIAGNLPTHPYDGGFIQTLRTHDENAYLALAAHIRSLGPSKFDTYSIGHDMASLQLDFEARQRKKTERLGELLPDELAVARMWPKEMLNISVDPSMVRIERGSGMLGMIGVVILEKGGRLEEFSTEQLAENPYLPRYTRIYARVYFFYND